MGVKMDEVSKQISWTKKIKVKFTKEHPSELQAEIDRRLVEALILSMDVKKYEAWATENDCGQTLSECIINRFVAEQKNKDMTPSVEDGDKIIAFDIRPEFSIPDRFFDKRIAPPMLK